MSTPPAPGVAASPGAALLSAWRRLAPFPGGRWLFTRLLARRVPYSASVRPRIAALEPGYARVTLPDHRGIRNHLGSIHAVALVNVAELASGLAMITALPPGIRGIVTRISVDYLKKARGRLVAEARCSPPPVAEPEEHDFVSEVRDAAGDVVARATVRWRLGPTPRD